MKLKVLIFLSILVVAVGCINGDGTDTTERPADTTGPIDTQTTTTVTPPPTETPADTTGGGPTDTQTTTTASTTTTTEYDEFDEGS